MNAADVRNRHVEVGEFLRRRRATLQPEDIGLARGSRRHVPGLRRDEVALRAGISVTLYTWLEQGRDIKTTHRVIDAVAEVLNLDADERSYVYRLTGIAVRAEESEPGPVSAEIL